MDRPRVGIFGLTGCAGDQLAVLNCEDELLDIMQLVEVRDFLMAASANDEAGHLDVAFVEGAVLSRRDEAALRRIRDRSDILVAIGTCAVWGGVAALDRDLDRAALLRSIYGPAGAGYDTLAARALHEVVRVDASITGCPIEKHEFLAALGSLLNGDLPLGVDYPVCTECRIGEHVCVLLENGAPCCGPITAAGCAARCPACGVPCSGCRGPAADANVEAGLRLLQSRGIPREQVRRRLRTFAPLGMT